MVSIEDLNIKLGGEIIFKNFCLHVKAGEKLALTGESGKGKSTLLNLLAGFVPQYSGKVKIGNIFFSPKTINEIRHNIAWLPQNTSLNFDKVSELLFKPFEFSINKGDLPTKEEIAEIFKKFELPESILSKNTKEISGGQQQRVILASCLLMNKPLLLMDEPTSALDNTVKMQIADYILEQPNITIIAATHDDYWIKKSDKTLHLK